MERENTVKFKSLEFAKRIVKLYKYLCDEKREFVISKQLLRSGTSIGANISDKEYRSIKQNCDELMKMLTAITKTTYSSLLTTNCKTTEGS